MNSNFVTQKPSGIAQLFQMTKNKFNKLDPVFENHLWQTQAEIQVWLVKSPLHIFLSV